MFAQQRQGHSFSQVYTLNWQNTIPLGYTADIVPSYCLNGINFNFTFFINPYIGVGADLSWAYNDIVIPAQEYHPSNNTAIYASGYNTTQTIPLKAQFKYMVNPYSAVKFYVGAGVGATSLLYCKQLQDFQVWDNSWGFLASPELGILVPFGKHSNWGVNLTAGYNWATNKAQNVYFNLGIFFGTF